MTLFLFVAGVSALSGGAGLFCLFCDHCPGLDWVGEWLAGESRWMR